MMDSPTPATSPLASADPASISPTTVTAAPAVDDAATTAADVDPLVAHTAQRLAEVLNDFKRQLDARDSTWASTHGTIELALQSGHAQTYTLSIVPDEDGNEYPVTVQAKRNKGKEVVNGDAHPPTSMQLSSTAYRPTRRGSDADLEKDLVSRKKRKVEEGGDPTNKRQRTNDDDMMGLLTKDGLEELLITLREDIQEDTAECVNHVQRLLRRLKQEWHEQSKWDCEQASTHQARAPMRASIAGTAETAAGGAFPSPSTERDDQTVSLPDLVSKQTRLLSSQIRWVEDCRRVSVEIHDKREENWRSSSASFHERNRQDRESFQHRMLTESGTHSLALNQILSEVRAIGLYTQSMKWETPAHLSAPPSTYPPALAPAGPTAPPQKVAIPVASGRATPAKPPPPEPNKRFEVRWKGPLVP